jgi:riboflavin biosynthesis pyrimidine reductase
LFSTLLEQGLVDELALSISAQIGGFGGLVLDGVSAQTRPKHTHVNDEGLFTLWDVT